QNPLAWSIVRRSRLVTAWWTAFLLDGLVRWIAALHPTDHALSSLRSTVEVRMVSDVVELVAAFLFLNVVLSLTARQTARIAALGA
ncbi:MAG: hypothetical protein JWM02_2643, partial [Frankiales bacterium]|nr:hypothetical protein [Frankiales bacterium]